ncbi:NAD(P)/FAD-dependent oxidoreductase [Paenibacillus sp.]|uniref:flavin-containing monooxygenase n=1 Tax=Paenibacillus sp. TaxID=58172 RepID=UPI002D28B69D|nr:NAD(P)/FAD-dependent oxidoreductase [Paenibacillus sp.]HZG58701.1 NAD(P)/FAD-dependent oxidoreductase [Paenibacillus sp.]
MENTTLYDAVVIGGGQAGLATAYYLRREGLRYVVLEAGKQAAGSWPDYYDSLTLFSPARYASLPGFPFPGDPDRYPRKREIIEYLTAYRERFRFPVVTNEAVVSVEKHADGAFVVRTERGSRYVARNVVSATGAFRDPYLPDVPDREAYAGRVLHSKDYRSPSGFEGRRVVVVGAGNSAVQIAAELAQTADVTLATRGPIRFLPQRVLGRDVHFWVRAVGFDRLPIGRWLRRAPGTDVLDDGTYRALIESRRPDRRDMFVRFRSDGVVWADGTAEAVDAVVFATGYRHRADYLRGLGALDGEGLPVQADGVSRRVEGLYFVGIPWQRSHASATLRGVGDDARYVVRRMKARGSRPGL